MSNSSANDVWGVGSSFSGNGFNLNQAFMLNSSDGHSWTVNKSSGTGYKSYLLGVAAIAPDNVWAVGSINRTSSNPNQVLLDHYNGSTWTVEDNPSDLNSSPFGSSEGLNAISAVSSSDIWAAGGFASGVGYTLVLHYNGSTWSVSEKGSHFTSGETGSSDFDGSGLNAISAASSSNVWATGSTGGKMLMKHWNGSNWKAYNPDPSGNGFGATGYGIAALSDGTAFVAGDYIPDANTTHIEPLIMKYDSSNDTWSVPTEMASIASQLDTNQGG